MKEVLVNEAFICLQKEYDKLNEDQSSNSPMPKLYPIINGEINERG